MKDLYKQFSSTFQRLENIVNVDVIYSCEVSK